MAKFNHTFFFITYDLSLILPLIAITLLIYLKDMIESNLLCYLILILVLVLITLILVYFAIYFMKKSGKETCNIVSISPNDTYYSYLFVYGFPIITFFLDYSEIISMALVLTIIIFALWISNSTIPNPILRILGYHFYSVNLKSGINNCLLISKEKELLNPNQIKSVHSIAPFVIIDAGKSQNDKNE